MEDEKLQGGTGFIGQSSGRHSHRGCFRVWLEEGPRRKRFVRRKPGAIKLSFVARFCPSKAPYSRSGYTILATKEGDGSLNGYFFQLAYLLLGIETCHYRRGLSIPTQNNDFPSSRFATCHAHIC